MKAVKVSPKFSIRYQEDTQFLRSQCPQIVERALRQKSIKDKPRRGCFGQGMGAIGWVQPGSTDRSNHLFSSAHLWLQCSIWGKSDKI